MKPPSPPPRGFPKAEFSRRVTTLRRAMRAQKLDSVLLTTEADVRYFSGFDSPFWRSPTRPWFLLIPLRGGGPVAVIPEIGASAFAATWVEDIRAWPSPRPHDEGVSLLVDCIRGLRRAHAATPAHGQINARNRQNSPHLPTGVGVVCGVAGVRRGRHERSRHRPRHAHRPAAARG